MSPGSRQRHVQACAVAAELAVWVGGGGCQDDHLLLSSLQQNMKMMVMMMTAIPRLCSTSKKIS
jgi:hypothetical protein